MGQRLGDLLISREALSALFGRLDGGTVLKVEGLPADARVVGVHHLWDRDCLAIRFASESFAEVYDGDPVPRLDADLACGPADAALAEALARLREMEAVFGDRVQDSEVARLAVLREREACAKEADDAAAEFARRSAAAPGFDSRDDWDTMRVGAEAVARAVRERGQP